MPLEEEETRAEDKAPETPDPNERTRAPLTAHVDGEPIRPFRLGLYFSFTGFVVILVFTLVLTIFISHRGKQMVLQKSQEFAQQMADILNHQVFNEFVFPIFFSYRYIKLSDPVQYARLDEVMVRIMAIFPVKEIHLYDLTGRIIYSTRRELVGTQPEIGPDVQTALKGTKNSRLLTHPGKSPFGLDNSYTLRTYAPLQTQETQLTPGGDILGVFEINQDLTKQYTEIVKFQSVSVGVSLIFVAVLFVILWLILARGERIIEARNEERRRLEETLNQAQRLAALGHMVASVSHEIKNPLGIISSTGQILKDQIQKYEPDNRLAGVIIEESRRLNGIVTEFLDFARPQTPRFKDCRVEDVLEQIIEHLTPSLDQEGIEVVRDYEGPEYVTADQDLLYRAFLNGFLNAIQVMPDGGVITVRTGLVHENGVPAPGMFEVEIADTGSGIDPEAAKRLFEPFFTTKNRGTGLGLAIVKNIVDSHHGDVKLLPEEEGGARLRIRIPLNQS